MARHILAGLVLTALFAQSIQADLFLNRKTGKSFYGYPTNRTRKNLTQVYEVQGDTFKTKSIDLSQYQVTYKAKGRKNNVVILPIQNPNVIISKAVSNTLAETIIHAANKGPRYILLEIDCPGGRGEYMKEIVAAIAKTDNCPVIAFITGGTTGGAFSAAAAVAISCDAVFIAPDAAVGTFAPVTNISAGVENPKDLYSPASLVFYSTYIAALAEQAGRNGSLAAAMIDTSIEIIEVSQGTAGTRKLIDKTEKHPSDAIIRTWSKTKKNPASNPVYTQNDITVNPLEYQLTMTAQEAVHTRVADKIVNSREEVLAFLGASDAKKQPTSRIDREIRTFVKNKRIMEALFFNIGELEIREKELESSLKELAEDARYSATSAIEQRRLRKLEYNEYQQRMREKDKYKITRPPSTRLRPKRDNVKSSPRRQRANQGAVNEVDPYLIRENMIRNELWQVLDDLSVNYSRVIGLGKKYPGTLPAGKDFKTAEKRYDQVLSKLDSGFF